MNFYLFQSCYIVHLMGWFKLNFLLWSSYVCGSSTWSASSVCSGSFQSCLFQGHLKEYNSAGENLKSGHQQGSFRVLVSQGVMNIYLMNWVKSRDLNVHSKDQCSVGVILLHTWWKSSSQIQHVLQTYLWKVPKDGLAFNF